MSPIIQLRASFSSSLLSSSWMLTFLSTGHSPKQTTCMQAFVLSCTFWMNSGSEVVSKPSWSCFRGFYREPSMGDLFSTFQTGQAHLYFQGWVSSALASSQDCLPGLWGPVQKWKHWAFGSKSIKNFKMTVAEHLDLSVGPFWDQGSLYTPRFQSKMTPQHGSFTESSHLVHGAPPSSANACWLHCFSQPFPL